MDCTIGQKGYIRLLEAQCKTYKNHQNKRKHETYYTREDFTNTYNELYKENSSRSSHERQNCKLLLDLATNKAIEKSSNKLQENIFTFIKKRASKIIYKNIFEWYFAPGGIYEKKKKDCLKKGSMQSIKEIAERTREMLEIGQKLHQLGMTRQYPAISELYEHINCYIKDGMNSSGEIDFPDANKKIRYLFCSKVGKVCKVDLIAK